LIDFRYHLVSIVAVFLALAIGIIVGSQALAPEVTSKLSSSLTSAEKYNRTLNNQNNQLRQQLAADNEFGQAAQASLLPGRLTGQSVVLIVAPGADNQTVTGVTSALAKAGATVTGQLILDSQFFDTGAATEQALKNTARAHIPPGVRLPRSASDPQISGQQEAAQVISAAIVAATSVPTMTQDESQQILTAFGQQGFLQVSNNGTAALAGQATMAVVVIPSTVPSVKVSTPFNLALISFTQDLQEASKGAVLAGAFSGSGQGSAIDAVSSGAAAVALTTVDDADSVVGQIIVVQALHELLSPNASPASYGARPGVVPSPAPSPIPSPSVSPTQVRKKKH
jgi:Copper transport outer membrane protein, MctB